MNITSSISASTFEKAKDLASAFSSAKPFRHVVIDDFLDRDYCERLLANFPPFDAKFAMNENGQVGDKAVIENIARIGADYVQLDQMVRSAEFLSLISEITGINELLYDPHYFGGGTHENREGQDLDPHVDFNRHPVERWHRRLNLIIYLNREWQDAWGGSLELHRDPREDDNEIKLVTPLFNRCVIFETNEISWHGFPRIGLPEARKGLTRKSIALYFYTKDRPVDECADTHSTIYVDRPLPETFQVGRTLSDEDLNALRILVKRRDQHNQRLYRYIASLQKQLDQAHVALNTGKVGKFKYFADRLLARLR